MELPGPRAHWGAARDWLPLLLVPLFYWKVPLLAETFHGGAMFDPLVQRWEAALFGGQPSLTMAARWPWPWLSEPLHAAYLSYYLIIYGPPLLLYLRGRSEDFDRVVFTVMLTFFAHYLFFIYLPVQGPRYLFPPPDGPLADGLLFQWTHRLLEGGSSQGAAFPSSHVGVSVAQTALAARLLPRLFPLLAVLTAGLAIGAVYGGFHYAIDALAGLVLGLVCFAIAPAIAARLGGERRTNVP
jgi:membrane-associated phospholipid phosphatase